VETKRCAKSSELLTPEAVHLTEHFDLVRNSGQAGGDHLLDLLLIRVAAEAGQNRCHCVPGLLLLPSSEAAADQLLGAAATVRKFTVGTPT
jgi:hypothetical protein